LFIKAAAALIRPREVGSSTLAFEIADTTPSLYLDLELREDWEKMSSAALFLGAYIGHLVILDASHRLPEPAGFRNVTPASNTDTTHTLAKILGLDIGDFETSTVPARVIGLSEGERGHRNKISTFDLNNF
jgi:hypothetical protein